MALQDKTLLGYPVKHLEGTLGAPGYWRAYVAGGEPDSIYIALHPPDDLDEGGRWEGHIYWNRGLSRLTSEGTLAEVEANLAADVKHVQLHARHSAELTKVAGKIA